MNSASDQWRKRPGSWIGVDSNSRADGGMIWKIPDSLMFFRY
jgi:hypothetical protein